MSYQNPGMRTDGHGKALKYCLIISAVSIGLIFLIGIIAAMPRWMKQWEKDRNHRLMYELFNEQDLTLSSEPPVVKKPYTVYGLGNDYKWGYCSDIRSDALLENDGITEKVKDARTCIFIWADSSEKNLSSDYYWDGNGGYEDACFSPVYMTVIDREAGIRYEDIPLGSTPMSSGNRQIGKHSMELYEEGKEWSTFDFDGWLPAHME